MRPELFLAAVLSVATPAAAAGVPEVVTDIPVVRSLVSAVMGDLGQPMLLLDAGADAHDFQLRPSQVRALNGAGLVVWIGPQLTPWLDPVLDDGGDAVRQLTLMQAPGTVLRHFGDEDTEPAHGDDDHDHQGTDPHAWLDLDNVAVWIGEIADALAALDPGNATVYRANATLAQRRAEMTDRRIAERLAPAQGKGIVLTHDAYGYFADRYGLTIAGSLAGGDAADPGAAHLVHLRDLTEGGAVACAFPEAGHDPVGLEQLVEGTSVRLGRALDPEGRLAGPEADLFVAIPEAISVAIADCITGR